MPQFLTRDNLVFNFRVILIITSFEILKDGSSDKFIYSEARVVTRIEMAQLQFRREHAHILSIYDICDIAIEIVSLCTTPWSFINYHV